MRVTAFLPHILRKTPDAIVSSPVGRIVHVKDSAEGLYVTMDITDPELTKILSIDCMTGLSIDGECEEEIEPSRWPRPLVKILDIFRR